MDVVVYQYILCIFKLFKLVISVDDVYLKVSATHKK